MSPSKLWNMIFFGTHYLSPFYLDEPLLYKVLGGAFNAIYNWFKKLPWLMAFQLQRNISHFSFEQFDFISKISLTYSMTRASILYPSTFLREYSSFSSDFWFIAKWKHLFFAILHFYLIAINKVKCNSTDTKKWVMIWESVKVNKERYLGSSWKRLKGEFNISFLGKKSWFKASITTENTHFRLQKS